MGATGSGRSSLASSAFCALQCSHPEHRQLQASIPVEGRRFKQMWIASFTSSSLVVLARSTTETSSHVQLDGNPSMRALPMLTFQYSLLACIPVLLYSDLQSSHHLSNVGLLLHHRGSFTLVSIECKECPDLKITITPNLLQTRLTSSLTRSV